MRNGKEAKTGCDEALLKGKRILLVEDEVIVAMDAEMILEDLGLNVVGTCHTLEAGLQAAETMEIDAAMLDVNLRGKKSFPIAEVLVARKIPFVFATGYDVIEWDGPAGRMDKPYEELKIGAALSAIFDRAG